MTRKQQPRLVRDADDGMTLCYRRLDDRPRLDGAADAAAELRRAASKLGADMHVENFFVLMLDARGRVQSVKRIATGTLTACLVHPREVFGPAIRAHAAQIVLGHNHPSEDPTPSPDDLTLTERVSEAGDLLGIPVVDHVVFTSRDCRSIQCE